MEVQVLEEGEIFDPQEFLDGLSQQWKQDPSSTPQISTEPFMNPPPPTRSDTQILGRFHGIREGYPRPQELFIPQQKDFERNKVEIRGREEKRKGRTEEFR